MDVGTEQWTEALAYSLLSEQIGHEHQNFQIQKFKGGGEKRGDTKLYTHVSKGKNNKRRKKKIK
jgi:hypothetical protein